MGYRKPLDSTTESGNDHILLDDFITQMKIDVDYHDYLVQVLTNQLDMLVNSADNIASKSNTPPPYDPEMLNEKDQFKCLLQIWK